MATNSRLGEVLAPGEVVLFRIAERGIGTGYPKWRFDTAGCVNLVAKIYGRMFRPSGEDVLKHCRGEALSFEGYVEFVVFHNPSTEPVLVDMAVAFREGQLADLEGVGTFPRRSTQATTTPGPSTRSSDRAQEERSAREWAVIVLWFLLLPFAVGMSLKYVLALDSGAGAVVLSYLAIYILAYLVGSGWLTLFLVLTGMVLLYWTWLLLEYYSYASEGPEAPNPFLEPTTEALTMTKDDEDSLVPRTVPKTFTERALSRPLNPFVTRLQKKRAKKSAELLDAETKLRQAEGRVAEAALARDRSVARTYRGDKIIETDTFEDAAEHAEAALRAKKAMAAAEDFDQQRDAKRDRGARRKTPESLEDRVGRAARAGIDLEIVKAQTFRKELKRIEGFVAGEVEAGRIDPEDREDEIADLADSLRARLDQIAFDEEAEA